MACFSCLFSWKAASSVKQSDEIDEVLSRMSNLTLYTHKELQNATEKFSAENKIGRGGFGPVYKGTLKDGSVAAIKVLSGESNQGVREFLTEIQVIASVDHENLVKLYGCCVEGNHRILVYHYLENNSLSKTLLGGGQSDIQFIWETRRKICIGIARGLTYLHEDVQPHVIHRDIKASNILLDKDLSPKISDFGLARLIDPNLTHVSTGVAGTQGYLALEVYRGGKVTMKADIYSFGVLVLEIVSGMRCTTVLPPKEQCLLEKVREYDERDKLVKLVDRSLINEDLNVEEARRFMKIGVLCTQDEPKLRPSMSTVVKMLTGEMDVDGETTSKPLMRSEFMDQRESADAKDKSYSLWPGALNQSSSSKQSTTSFATMSFNSIYDRSN